VVEARKVGGKPQSSTDRALRYRRVASGWKVLKMVEIVLGINKLDKDTLNLYYGRRAYGWLEAGLAPEGAGPRMANQGAAEQGRSEVGQVRTKSKANLREDEES
jgi:hypothetical protein